MSEEKKTEGNGPSPRNKLSDFADSVENFATRTVESMKKTIDKALTSRNTVLSIRVSDEANQRLTMLVEAGIFKSRSESAAFLIGEGIKRHEELFSKVASKMSEIEKIKEELQKIIVNTGVEENPPAQAPKAEKKAKK